MASFNSAKDARMPTSFNDRCWHNAPVAVFCTALAVACPALAKSPAPSISYDIPAQSLGEALLTLGRQSGLQISFQPAAVAGKVSLTLQGQYPALSALNQLLAGSGLALRADGPGRYIVFIDETTPFSPSRLEPVRVYGEQIGERVYSREEITQTPSSNRDISTLVATDPAVRTNPGAAGSKNRGSLDVEDVSFHGASPYQNLFQIDGMDATNRVDPASKNSNLVVNNVPSNLQSYFIDTSLLEAVQVHDSFVPVEYGHFTGGVVDAKLRRFSGENHLNLDYRWNTSNMTRQRTARGEEQRWAQGRFDYSPKWKKDFYSLSGDLTFSEKAGMVLAMSRRQSDITRAAMGVDDEGRPEVREGTYRSQVDNLLTKFSVRPDSDTVADLTLKSSAYHQALADAYFRDTTWENHHSGSGVNGNLEHLFQRGRFSLQVGWDRSTSHRQSVREEFVSHFTPPVKTVQYSVVGFGKEQTLQDTSTLKSRVDLDPLRIGTFAHNLYAGAELAQIRARFKRFNDAYAYRRDHLPNGSIRDSNRTHYLAGTANVGHYSASLYLSDRIEWRRLALDTGLRYDRDSFLGNNNLAPRTHLDWNMFGTGNTVLSVGWSRYYGAQVLGVAMQAERARLKINETDKNGKAVANGRKPYKVDYKGLRTPYDDEWAISLRQRWAGLDGLLSYVHRNGRDQWTRVNVNANTSRYHNDGRSTTDGINLTVHTLHPWHLGTTRWTMRATWGWQRRGANTELVKGYNDHAGDPDERVLYNDVRIRAFDLPTNSFFQPQVANFTLIGSYPNAGLMWSNVISWRGKRDAIFYTGKGPAPEFLSSYTSERLPSYWTWDTKLRWRPTFVRDLDLTIEVLNLLNRMPAVTGNRPRLTMDYRTYQSGRELWLQVGYRF